MFANSTRELCIDIMIIQLPEFLKRTAVDSGDENGEAAEVTAVGFDGDERDGVMAAGRRRRRRRLLLQ